MKFELELTKAEVVEAIIRFIREKLGPLSDGFELETAYDWQIHEVTVNGLDRDGVIDRDKKLATLEAARAAREAERANRPIADLEAPGPESDEVPAPVCDLEESPHMIRRFLNWFLGEPATPAQWAMAARLEQLARERDSLRETGEAQRGRIADLEEAVRVLRAQLEVYDVRGASDRPTRPGSYLVMLAGARVWHEAYWTRDGWRVLVERHGKPVTHWRRMPPVPADRPLPYTPPTAGECAR